MTVIRLYAGLLGLIFVALAANVIRTRRSVDVSLGSGGDLLLERRIRAHGNCAEYAPLGLLLIGLAELAGTTALLLHVVGAVLLVGRAMHGWALSSLTLRPVARVGGTALTLTAIGVASLLCIASLVEG